MDNLELLERLGEIDPPTLDVTDRVIAAIEGATASETASNPTFASDASRRPRRFPGSTGRAPRARKALVGAGLLVAAAAAVTAIVVPSSTKHGATVSPHGNAITTSDFQLVDATSFPFSTIGGGVDAITLDCVTTTVCYAAENGGPPSSAAVLEKTIDGGRTWQATAPIPGGSVMAFKSTSCVTAEICAFAAPASRDESDTVIVQTTDGGATWTTISVPLPPVSSAYVGQIVCVDATRCVASMGTLTSGEFVSTDDDGATWSTSANLPVLSGTGPEALQCDPDGECTAVVVGGSVATGAGGVFISVLRSSDLGKTWIDVPASASVKPGSGPLLVTCGDARHCLLAYNSSVPGVHGFVLATTADSGTTWTVAPAPASWPDTPIALDCSSGSDCWISASDAGYRTVPANPPSSTTTTLTGNSGSNSPGAVAEIGYKNPTIEQTTNGGQTWTALSVPPTANGAPMAVVGPLSCVGGAGCVGIGATEVAFDPPRARPSQLASELANSRVVVSDLTGAAPADPGQ